MPFPADRMTWPSTLYDCSGRGEAFELVRGHAMRRGALPR
jgi:hypothetical protein